MAYKNREASKELQILQILYGRMDLNQTEKQHYFNLQKGFEGEVMFDQLVEGAGLHQKFYILNDLLLKCDHTTVQIDSTVITQHAIIPSEIKNFEGNLYYKNNNFYNCNSDTIYQNPLDQLNRIKISLCKLLKKNGFNIPIEGHVVFINSECYLYQAPLDEPIVYYTQLNRFLRSLHAKPAYLNDSHKHLADFLVNLHMSESPMTQLPTYRFESVRKGVNCGRCFSFSVTVAPKKIVCTKCGNEESYENCVLRSVKDITLLFPEIKITLNVVLEWSNFKLEKWTVRRILKKHFRVNGYGQWTYYE